MILDKWIDKWGEWYGDERHALAFDTTVLAILFGTALALFMAWCKYYG